MIEALSLRKILGRDYEVVVCTNGRAALDALDGPTSLERHSLRHDDALQVTGMDVYEELRGRAPEIADRMIFMTGGTFTARARAFLGTVPNVRVDKPIDIKVLRALIRRAGSPGEARLLAARGMTPAACAKKALAPIYGSPISLGPDVPCPPPSRG